MQLKPDHRLERLVFFSDAVFAIAITLLVLDFKVPHVVPHGNSAAWVSALLALVPTLLSFLLSFFVIGQLWIAHHELLSMVNRFHRRLFWPNLLLLLTVIFLPFATALLSTGPPTPVPFVTYCTVLMLAVLSKAWLGLRALKPDLLAPGETTGMVTAESRRMWIMPIATLVALLLAFYIPGWNMMALLLLPMARLVPYFRVPHTQTD